MNFILEIWDLFQDEEKTFAVLLWIYCMVTLEWGTNVEVGAKIPK